MRETRAERVKHQYQAQHRSRFPLFVAVAVVLLLAAVLVWTGPFAGQKDSTKVGETENSAPSSENQTVPQPIPNEEQAASQTTEPEPVLVPEVPEEDSWRVMLVNSTHGLPDGYVPELVKVDQTDFKFDVRAADSLNAMLQAARAEGLSPMICSSYRSWERQNTLFEKQVVKQQNTGLDYDAAYEKAKTVVAFPGTSEHQTGLAADIVATSHQLLDDSQEQTAEQQWLMAHSWEYGFILRYPKDKSDITGIIYEPWHYRYVGYDIAKYIYENGLCLEEYWQQLEAQQASQLQQA